MASKTTHATLVDAHRANPRRRSSITFPRTYLLIVDESHATIPQVGGMYEGDYSRKRTLVDYGFRLPSAVDNRPLKFHEFERCLNQVVYVSATPGPYELEHTGGVVVEQIIRPTGLLDPIIEVRPAKGQVDHLLGGGPGRNRSGRACVGDDAHQTHGRGFERVLS